MPYPMKIHPINFNPPLALHPKPEASVEPILKLKFRRLFERSFSGVLRASAQDKSPDASESPLQNCSKDMGEEELEPSSVCLVKMVQNFMEETNEKQRCGRKECNYFNGSCTDGSDEDAEHCKSSTGHACDVLKSLVPCSSLSERNLLADTANIVDKNKISKFKDHLNRKIVADGLIALGYKASICRSQWDRTPSFLAGEYEYVDVVVGGERLIIDKAHQGPPRPTKAYRQVLQLLPDIFVGKGDRLERIIITASEAAKQSLKKKGMAVPPWREADYVKAKWLSPFTRDGSNSIHDDMRRYGSCDSVFAFFDGGVDGMKRPMVKKWEPLEIGAKKVHRGVRLVTGLASVIDEDKT